MNPRCGYLFSSCVIFLPIIMKGESPTRTISFDTFHGVRDHKKKKDIHMKVGRKVRDTLVEKKKEVIVPMVV